MLAISLPEPIFILVFMIFVITVFIWRHEHDFHPDVALLKKANTFQSGLPEQLPLPEHVHIIAEKNPRHTGKPALWTIMDNSNW